MPSDRFVVLQAVASVLLALAAMWGATQWAAAMLGYQAALGQPLASLAGIAIYAPWQIFPWWLAFDHQAPDVFAKAGLIAALGGVAPALVAIGGAASRARAAPVITTYGSARWAELTEIRRAGLLADDGVVLGRYDDEYLRHDGPEHVLAVAPTRSGKGVGLVVPTLLTWTGSTVVHDIKGENWALTAGWRSRFSHCLMFDPTSPLSSRFNPLLEVRRGVSEVRDVQNIADILVDPDGGRERRDHWEKTAHALLTGTILHVLYAEADKTLHRVATFLSDPSQSIECTLRTMLTTNHLGDDEVAMVHPVVASIARELLNKSDNERSGVVSTAMSLLGLYRDPIIAATTATSDWRIADLMSAERPVSLYLVVPPSDLSRTRPLMRLILNQIARRLTEELPDRAPTTKPNRQLLLMLDEFPALGRLEFFEHALAFLAGYGVRCFLIAQSLNQIEKAYGPNNAIVDNCHVRVAFAPNDERTAKRLSDTLGTMTELRSQRNLAGHRLAPWLSRMSVAEQETARPLLTAGEILQLPADRELVLVSGVPPIKARKLQFFTDDNFIARCLPPPRLEPCGAIDRPPLRRDAGPQDWSGCRSAIDYRLQLPWADQIATGGRHRKQDHDRFAEPRPGDFDDVATLDGHLDSPEDAGRLRPDCTPGRDPHDDLSDL